MEKATSDALISNAARTIFTYCRARTGSREEAEDLSQDILLALLRSHGRLRDDKAFYGFMWAVAGNVYKNWLKKRTVSHTEELDQRIPDNGIPPAERMEGEEDIRRLHRELSLLTERHRKVIVLYYFDGQRISEISTALGISESMVKFLLFKSRKILKEGLAMGICMNLKVEMPRRGLTYKALSMFLGISEKAIRNKIAGRSDFTMNEANRLHGEFFQLLDKETLFRRDTA